MIIESQKAFKEKKGVNRAIIGNSKRLLMKPGFKKETHFRENFLFNYRFSDSIIYSLLETDVIMKQQKK